MSRIMWLVLSLAITIAGLVIYNVGGNQGRTARVAPQPSGSTTAPAPRTHYAIEGLRDSLRIAVPTKPIVPTSTKSKATLSDIVGSWLTIAGGISALLALLTQFFGMIGAFRKMKNGE